MTTIAHIAQNSKGSGDWIIVRCDEWEYKGHSIPTIAEWLKEFAEIMSMADSIKIYHLTDEEMEGFENYEY